MSTGSPEDARLPWSSPTLRAVLLSTLMLPLGVPLLSPILPAFRNALGITAPEAALLVTMYFAPGVLLAPPFGLLADRYGRRRVLVPALLVFGAAGTLVAVTDAFLFIIALRVVQGTAAAGVIVLTTTIVGDTFEGVQRNAVLGLNFGALGLAAAVYPLVGGLLAPYGWQAPFYVTAIAIPVAVVALTHLPPPTAHETTNGIAYVRTVLAAMPATRALVLYGATVAIELVALGVVFTILPFLLAAEFSAPPVGIGAVVTIETIVAALVAVQNGRLARRFPNEPIVAAGFTAFGVGLLGAWVAPSPVLIGVSVIPMGVGVGLILPSVDAAISGAVPADARAGAVSLRTSATFLGRAGGPLLFTGVAVVTGYRPLLLGAGSVVLLGGLLGLLAVTLSKSVRSR